MYSYYLSEFSVDHFRYIPAHEAKDTPLLEGESLGETSGRSNRSTLPQGRDLNDPWDHMSRDLKDVGPDPPYGDSGVP
jgi:hypothetical protein